MCLAIWLSSSGSKQFGMTLKKQWLGSFAWKVIVCTTKVIDKTFRNEKRYEDKS